MCGNSIVSGKSGLKRLNPLRYLYYAIRSGTAPFEKVLHYIPDNAEILDFGCGYGILIDLIDTKKNNCRITGIDINEKRIEALKEKNPHNQYISGDVLIEANKLLSENLKFDCIIIFDVLYLLHPERQREMIRISSKILKPSGVLLIKEMDKKALLRFAWTYLQEFFFVKIIKMTKTKENGLYFMSTEEISKELSANDMQTEIVKMGSISHPHVLIIGKKHNSRE
ncbi:MAG: class I SAM-dependent methyltransferase [Deltaproteobacteria bacterium]|nr:class I SAM-dependent methyltransferase [Deltaproteobacteria bacterium]